MQKSITKTASQTKKIGENLAKEIVKQKPGNTALVLGLHGDLGAGKTTFLQGFARGLEIKEKVLSPTFIILKKFQIPTNKVPQKRRLSVLRYGYFYHIDCYRLKNEKDLEVLGFKEIMLNPKNIIAIEWPERISKILPKDMISINFKHGAGNQRRLIIR